MTYNPPALNHNYHPDPAHRYGCIKNAKPRHLTEPYWIQDGWNPDGTRRMVLHRTDWLPIACGHTYRYDDPACEGCPWRTV